MKLSHTLPICLLAVATSINPAQAWLTSGLVFCDSNQNEQIDSNDNPLPGVLVVVTNLSGTYSNANFTTTPDGGFILDLPSVPDTYVEYLHPLTLPSDAFGVLPGGGVYTFTLSAQTQTNFTGSFLVASGSCTNAQPPPVTNTCCLAAAGKIGPKKGKSLFEFCGSVLPACGCATGDSGFFEVVANCVRLHFRSCSVEIVDCGEATSTSGCRLQFMDFRGTGVLTGIAGCKSNFGLVYFTAHAEDRGHGSQPGALYFRAFDAQGNTLLLISTDTSDASDVAPVTVCNGQIIIGTDCCNIGGHGHGDGDHGKGGDNGHGKGGGNGKGNGDCNGQGDSSSGKGGHGKGKGHGKS